MNDQQLRSFLVAARLGSMSLAAKREHLTVQALAQRINTLEGELGFSLLDRTPHGVTLTPQGEVFADAAQKALAMLEEGVAAARQSAEEGNVLIKIGHPWRLFPALQNLCAQYVAVHPAVSFSYVSTSGKNPIENLDNGLFDMAMLPYGVGDLPPDIVQRKVHDGTCVVAFSPESPLANLDVIQQSDLEGKTLIFSHEHNPSGPFNYLEEWPRSIEIISDTHMSGETMLLQVLTNDNMAVMFSDDTVSLTAPTLESRPMAGALPYPTGLFYRADAPAAVRQFAHFVEENYEQAVAAHLAEAD